SLFLEILLSCSNSSKQKDEELTEISTKNQHQEFLMFDFPDTVQVNKIITGRLQYNLNNGDESNMGSRHILLFIKTEKKERFTLDEIKRVNSLGYEDTIGNGFFTFEAVFSKQGRQFLNGVIDDVIFLEDNNLQKDSLMMKRKETQFTKDVYVV